MTLETGSQLGRYRIGDLLGAGGMGMVYRARDDRLERDVAIKVLPPSVVGDDDALRRFRKEALALAKVSHPGIATLYDVDQDGETAYLVMELVPGESLADRLARGPLSLAESLDVTVQVAGALGEAHEHGVVHRDLKPANIMITPKGRLKVLDFGLAKLLGPKEPGALTLSRSEMGEPAGTPRYMSPEQALGEPVDLRTDLWSLGVVLYESISGRAPFHGENAWALLHAVTSAAPLPVRSAKPELPAEVDTLVERALAKDPGARFRSATEMGDAAAAILQSLSQPHVPHDAHRMLVGRRVAVTAVLVPALAIGVVSWFAVRASRRSWARHQALAAVAQLVEADRPLAAFRLLRKAEAYVPDDTALASFAKANVRQVSVASSPAGVPVAIQDYLTPDSAWYDLGVTPLKAATIPDGYFRWRLSPAGSAQWITAPMTGSEMHFALDSALATPPGMVRVGARQYEAYIAFIGWVGPYALPAFDMDKFEVTNREYQEFVDGGGYRDRRYWLEPFVDQGHTLSWDDAMARFRDQSGRPGPAAWAGGHFPDGKDSYPVSGISWYEAAAYAAYRKQSLPTMAQWHEAGPPDIASFVARLSNVSGKAVAPVGSFNDVGPYGTYDMAGNVREWAFNANDAGARFILGGAWSSPGYLYAEAETLPPFDRSLLNGVRCVRNLGPLPPGAANPIKVLRRDYSTYVPASDAVFRAYLAMYAYEKTPLNASEEGIVKQTADWRVEKVTYDSPYSHERIAAYLYLPTHVAPPYQTVLFFPSARVLFQHDSRRLGDEEFFDYVVQSGRAVLYPVYQDTYERRTLGNLPGVTEARQVLLDRSKDVERALDYLQTRPDIAHDREAFLGVSMGAAEGAIFAEIAQQRLRTAVFLDGGYFLGKFSPGVDQADFVPRLKIPVLMVNGRYDPTFSYEESQLPMFRMLGTPAADKKQVLLEASHDVTAQRPVLVREVLAWLDKYLGRVQ